jgi:hypothetical protein
MGQRGVEGIQSKIECAFWVNKTCTSEKRAAAAIRKIVE